MRLFSRVLAALFLVLTVNAAHAATNLTLNKTHTAPILAIGAPFTYTLTLTLSGDANSHVTIAEQFPPGFVFVSASCVGSAGASCVGATLTAPPVFGEFDMPNNGVIKLTINGYFTTEGRRRTPPPRARRTTTAIRSPSAARTSPPTSQPSAPP